jgi:acyl carrier protein
MIEFSDPGDDAVCPGCGAHLLLAQMIVDRFRRKLAEQFGIDEDQFPDLLSMNELGADSLDTVELVMELEGDFDYDLPIDEELRINTIREAVKMLSRHRKKPE